MGWRLRLDRDEHEPAATVRVMACVVRRLPRLPGGEKTMAGAEAGLEHDDALALAAGGQGEGVEVHPAARAASHASSRSRASVSPR